MLSGIKGWVTGRLLYKTKQFEVWVSKLKLTVSKINFKNPLKCSFLTQASFGQEETTKDQKWEWAHW